MKKVISTIIALMTVIITVNAQDPYPTYFTADELPNGVLWLPEPPDTISGVPATETTSGIVIENGKKVIYK